MLNESHQPQPLVLLDQGAAWDGPPARLVHWAEMEVPPGHDSIPWLVENQARLLRQEYLAWVHDLGESVHGGRSLKEHLDLGGGFSFWWLTCIAEKSPLKSPGIFEVFKLRALERLYETSGCRGIILCSANPGLNRVLSQWCSKLGHPYHWERLPKSRTPPKLREKLRLLPYPLQALATLIRRLWSRRLRLSAIKRLPPGGRQATVVTYFPNLDPNLARQGVFRSRYWGELHDLLDKSPWLVNWIWVYVPSDEISFAEAKGLRQRFQEKAGARARYFFLEEFLTAGVLLKAVQLYLRLCRRGLRLKSVRQAFHFPGSSLNFWPVLARDWGGSLFGSEALEGCLALATFESLAVLLPPQEWGLYLWENLPWERALNWAWKDAGQGKLIGFQHATLRFFDLRFFEDPRSYRLAQYPPPLPDLLAVNGAGPLSLLDEVGYPRDRRVTVEALRYQFLGTYLDRRLAREPTFRATGLEPRTLLVVTGYLASETSAQLRLLAQAAPKGGLAGYEKVLVKPHPDCPVNGILTEVGPDLKVSVVQESLSDLWPQATVVYAANSTSASVEAALMGLPLLVHVVDNSFNFSPLRGQPGVQHVGTVAGLLQGLAAPKAASAQADYFCLDKGLPRWQALLGN